MNFQFYEQTFVDLMWRGKFAENLNFAALTCNNLLCNLSPFCK